MKKQRGFALIELLIVIAIIGIIAVILIPKRQDRASAVATCPPQGRDNGVWYFECDPESFSYALSAFRKVHPELRIISVAASASGSLVVTELAPH